MVTLDGVMEAPDRWAFPFITPELEGQTLDELFAGDALLMGRLTYQGFVDYWPSAADETGLADRMNGMPKFVVSTTLEEAEWNASLVKGNVSEEVARLKQQPGGNILLLASADLVNTLMEHDLIDEYRLRVAPVVVGSGKRLFEDGCARKALELVNSETFGTGVVSLTYRRLSR